MKETARKGQVLTFWLKCSLLSKDTLSYVKVPEFSFPPGIYFQEQEISFQTTTTDGKHAQIWEKTWVDERNWCCFAAFFGLLLFEVLSVSFFK